MGMNNTHAHMLCVRLRECLVGGWKEGGWCVDVSFIEKNGSNTHVCNIQIR